MAKQTKSSPLGDETLCTIAQFRSALGDTSRSTFHRWTQAKMIPPPDGYVLNRPVWRLSTVRQVAAKFCEVEGGGK